MGFNAPLVTLILTAFVSVQKGYTLHEPRPLNAEEARLSSGMKRTLTMNNEMKVAGESRFYHTTVPCQKYPSPFIMGRGDTVTFTSPRYPRNYPKSTTCSWKLQGDRDDITIGVECSYFRIHKKRRGGVCPDYLSLNGGKFCGKYDERPIGWWSTGSSLFMKFHSNRRKQHRGFTCVATAVCPSACGIPNRSGRIVGGMSTEQNEYPWMVSLTFSDSPAKYGHSCGGSVINKRWILTSATCINWGVKAVFVGLHDFGSLSFPYNRTIPIENVVRHPNFTNEGNDLRRNDIGLVKLSEDLDFSVFGVSPVCLPSPWSSDTYEGVTATATGWGYNETNSIPDILDEVDVSVYSNSECLNHKNITDDMLCAGVSGGGKDPCYYDEGGPLIYETSGPYTQIGIINLRNPPCNLTDAYGVYTRITPYMDWIYSVARHAYCA